MIAATSVVVIPIIPGMVQALLGAASGFDAGGVTGEGGVLVGTSGLVGGDVGDPCNSIWIKNNVRTCLINV